MKMLQKFYAGMAFALPFSLLVLVGCGGGVGSGGTGTYTYGPINGFGSIIVGGVRFDDSSARVEDDGGSGRTAGDLKLGMTVAIESDAISTGANGAQATASVVRYGSVLIAPVTSIDIAASTLVALGQTVQIQSTTVIDDSLGTLAALQVGRVIEVHGLVDTAGQRIVATRVEAAPANTVFKVRGAVTALDTTAKTFRLGAATFSYGNATATPNALVNGQLVTLRVAAAPVAGVFAVSSFGGGVSSMPDGDRDGASVRGVVTAFTSVSNFRVNDTAVDATGALFPDGSAGVVAGARVKVEGRFSAGKLLANKVEIDSETKIQGEGIDLRGTIESLNAGDKTFRLRGSTVFYGVPGIRYDDGSEADLTTGRKVEVKGVLSSDGKRVEAQRIKIDR
jgi:Domain of unknown function (DUF5666)